MELDDLDDYRQPVSRKLEKQRSLAFQIALGIWLGGVALMITGFLFHLLLISFAGKLMSGEFSIRFDAPRPQSEQFQGHGPEQPAQGPRRN
ncbi:hypothetical protein [Zestomonas carbonaria]|uniref:hypothetical protein n=1 Tax=Zestomonas carbonaria TaxID=2762745 RepID=UPI0016569E03|nr:hypothetical protein [Pseudomonas carbonaria]